MFNRRLWGNCLRQVIQKLRLSLLTTFQHSRKLSRGKHDGLLVYNVKADKAKRALTACFLNSKVRSRSPSLFVTFGRLSKYAIYVIKCITLVQYVSKMYGLWLIFFSINVFPFTKHRLSACYSGSF